MSTDLLERLETTMRAAIGFLNLPARLALTAMGVYALIAMIWRLLGLTHTRLSNHPHDRHDYRKAVRAC